MNKKLFVFFFNRLLLLELFIENNAKGGSVVFSLSEAPI